MDIINKRRSVRNFKDIDVERSIIEKLLRAGMQSPSAKNQQPWVFLVIKDKIKLEKLSVVSNLFLKCNTAIFLLIDTENLPNPEMAPADMGACTQNILLECASLNLGACWIGTAGRENRINVFREVLNIPSRFEPFSTIVLGYPQNESDNHFVDRYNPNKVFYEVL
ncbi:MAG: nitroreductase family protein [Bacilli bacterium]